MANQQLVGYIKQQFELGESETPIKNSLLSVGWAEADVNEALKEAGPGGGVKAPSMSASPSMAAKPAMQSAFAEPKKVININNLGSSPSKNETFFNPKASASEPAAVNEAKGGNGSVTAAIVLGILAVAFAGASAFLYMGKSSTQAELNALKQQISALGSQAAALTKTEGDLTSQIGDLTSLNADLAAHLGLFHITPAGTSTPTVSTVSIKGKLIFGTRYALTTSRGITLGVKNSKDPKIDAVLKPLVGTEVELTGTTVPGSREITVTLVNGSAPTPPAPPAPPASTSSQSTSTVP